MRHDMRPIRRWSLGALVLATTAASACAPSDQENDDVQNNGSLEFVLPKERFMYIQTINRGGTQDPDMVVLVGTDPGDPSRFGKIFKRVDMPNVGDELHHFALSHDKKRLLVPGLFSGRMHVFDVNKSPTNPALQTVRDLTTSGYIIPHSVVSVANKYTLVTMIGAATPTTGPGGVIKIDSTGAFAGFFGPGPSRTPAEAPPPTMYDFDYKLDINRGISTTFGLPADVGGAINPAGLGSVVAVWNIQQEKVIQTVDLGANSGALEVRFIKKPGSTHGYINTPGTSTIWLFEDEDHDGLFSFHQVLGPTDGLNLPVDMLLSLDARYMYIANWFGDNVQQWDITDRYHPVLVAQATVPHANMLRLSTDGKRLYVTNSLLSTWDDDPNFGPPRNTNYGLWAYRVNTNQGGLTSFSPGATPWVQFDSVQKKTSVGPAGPHMMLFDPAASIVDQH